MIDNYAKPSNKVHRLFGLIPYELWFIVILAFFLRLYHLGYNDLWFDEVVTLTRLIHPNFLKIWNPPLYYAILLGWVRLFGFSEFSLRFPSLLFSVACLPVIFLLGRELFNKSAGLYAALIFALSPFQLWYAQEARAYALLVLCGLVSVYFQFLFISRDKKRFLYGSVIFCILGLYTHPYYVFFAVSQFICHLIFKTEDLSRILRIILLITLAFVPLMGRTWYRFFWVLRSYWVPSPSWRSIFITMENFILGYNTTPVIYLLSYLLVLTLFLTAVWFVLHHKEIKDKFIFCGILFIMPVILAFLFSKLVVDIYLDRGLIISTPYYYLLLGLGLSVFRKKIVNVLATMFLLFLLIISIHGFLKNVMPNSFPHHIGVYIKKPVKTVVDFLNKKAGPNDIIAFTNESVMLPFIWYSEGKKAYFFYLMNDKNPSVLYGRYRFFFIPGHKTPSYRTTVIENDFNIPVDKTDEVKFEKLWVLLCDWERDGLLDRNSFMVKKHLDKKFSADFKEEFNGLWVYRYAK